MEPAGREKSPLVRTEIFLENQSADASKKAEREQLKYHTDSQLQCKVHRQSQQDSGERKTFREAFRELRSVLESRLDTRNGLLKQLLTRRVLLVEHVEDICQAGINGNERAARLMDILERRPDELLTEFCQALEDSGQHDLAQLIHDNQGERPAMARLITRWTFDQNEDVRGVAMLDNRIFIVLRGCNTISNFIAREPFKRQQDIVVGGLKRPTGIVASVKNGCLYVPDEVADVDDCVVWRINVANGAVVRWLSGVRALSASAASDGKLLLLVAVDMQGTVADRTRCWHGEVQIYSPDAVREAVVKLPHDVISPLHVVMTTRKSFVVCYGCMWQVVNGVCEVDMTGHILKAFTSEPGNDVDQLNAPCHLTLADGDQVLVADSRNDRVLLLNEQLAFESVVVTWNNPESSDDDEAELPVRLHYDRQTGRLLVGLLSGHIDLYKMK